MKTKHTSQYCVVAFDSTRPKHYYFIFRRGPAPDFKVVPKDSCWPSKATATRMLNRHRAAWRSEVRVQDKLYRVTGDLDFKLPDNIRKKKMSICKRAAKDSYCKLIK